MLQTKIAITTILAVIYLFGIPFQGCGFSVGAPWWTHFTYIFFHGNLIHLACNVYALWLCLNERTYPKHILIPILYAITVTSSFVYIPEQPTVGISGAIFAMLGINLVRVPTRINILYMVVILISGFVIPQIAGAIHLTSFLIGCTIAIFTQNIKRFKHDYR